MAEIWILREIMKFFLLDFLNLMSCKNRDGVKLVNIFLKIFSQFFKIRVECPFKDVVFFLLRILVGRNKTDEQQK